VELKRGAKAPTADPSGRPALAAHVRSRFSRGKQWSGKAGLDNRSASPIEVFVEVGEGDAEYTRLRVEAHEDPAQRCVFLGRLASDEAELAEWSFVGARNRAPSKPHAQLGLIGKGSVGDLRLRWIPGEKLVGWCGAELLELTLAGDHVAEQDALLERLSQIDGDWKRTQPVESLERAQAACRKIEQEATSRRWFDLAAKARLESGSITFERLIDAINLANNLGGVKRFYGELRDLLEPLLAGTDTEPIEGGGSVRARALYYLAVGAGASSLYHRKYFKSEHERIYRECYDFLTRIEQEHPEDEDAQGRSLAREARSEFERLRQLMQAR
jgi:hypothetical protein